MLAIIVPISAFGLAVILLATLVVGFVWGFITGRDCQ